MPTSNLWLVPKLVHYVAEAKPRSVLDVGPGHGKYAVLLREYVPSITTLDAIEAEPRYLEAFPWLTAVYDRVHLGGIEDRRVGFLERYELVLMVDVLEHLDRDASAELLARIPGRIVICTPRDYFQNPEHVEYPTETHRSVWTAGEIAEAAGRDLECVDVDAWGIGGVLVRVSAR